MTDDVLFELKNGFIHHWLVTQPIMAHSRLTRKNAGYKAILQHPPVEFGKFSILNSPLVWTRFTCKPDHLLDFTPGLAPHPGCQTLWAYTEIESPLEIEGQMHWFGYPQADLWINDRAIANPPSLRADSPWQETRGLKLSQGRNSILVRLTACDNARLPFAAAFRFDFPARIHIRLPVSPELDHDRSFMERAFEAATTDRYIYVEKDYLSVAWPAEYSERSILDVQVRQNPQRLFGMASGFQAEANKSLQMIQAYDVADGEYQLRLMPIFAQYSTLNMRIKRDIPIFFSKAKFHADAEDSLEKRADEFVRWAYQRVDDLWGQVAQMAAERWNLVNPDLIRLGIEKSETEPDSLTHLCLTGMFYRYARHPEFLPELLQKLSAALQKWDLSPRKPSPFPRSEGETLCQAVVEMLAGQAFAGEVFAKTGQTGAWHAQNGAARVRSWIAQCCQVGFKDWYDGDSIEKLIAGLTHVIDLSTDEDLSELAGVVLDKLFFSLAIHNFKGVSAAPRSGAAVPQVFGARFDPLSGISRLMWGQGAQTIHLAGTASLLCTAGYSMPQLFNQIALDDTPDVWMKEGQGEAPCEANLALYKTTNYMIASAQDYCPGKAGHAEHLWQATLSPDAVVFTTHPANFSLEKSHQPNFWCGNACLPRIVQWKNFLAAFYQLPADDLCGFTHAYFPEAAFDQVEIGSQWAFGHKGDSYIALFAPQGLERITSGDTAYRELRSYGNQQIWICLMGSLAENGSFADFINQSQKSAFQVQGLHLTGAWSNDVRISCGWQEALVINGNPQPLSNFPQFDTPYGFTAKGAQSMEIRFGADAIQLNFELI